MDFLAPILKTLIAGNVKTTVERTRNQLICAFIIGVSLLFSAAFLCIALYLYLIRIMDPIWVAVIGVAFFAAIALTAFVVYKVISKRKRQAYEQQLEAQKASLMAASTLALLPAVAKRKLWVAALPVLGIAAIYFLNGKDDKTRE